jgi:hypothetical protein
MKKPQAIPYTHKKLSQWIAMEKFEKAHPHIASKYFDLQYKDLAKATCVA